MTDKVYPSIAIGHGTATFTKNQVVLGTFNKVTASTAELVIGSGQSNSRSNCFRITSSGTYATGNYNATGADYAEQFEWQDKNPNKEERIGRFVTIDGEAIKLASSDDFVLGIISGNPSVIGDSYDDQWQGMYITDIYGRFIWENITVPAEYDDEGNLICDEYVETTMKVNPNYDKNTPYIPRSERPEWAVVGMMGKLVLIDDGTCEVNSWAKPSENGIGTKSETQTKFRVMARLDDTHVRVLIL